MVSYLKSVEKHVSDIPYIAFKLYNNIFVPSWVDLDPCPKRRVVEVNFRLSKKVLMISVSSLVHFVGMHVTTFPPWLGYPIRNHPYQPLHHFLRSQHVKN
jgi:hypothetical protein